MANGLPGDVRVAVVSALQLGAQCLGEPHGGWAEVLLVRVVRCERRVRADMIIGSRCIRCDGLYPDFVADAVLELEIRRWVWLGDEQALFAETGEQLGLP